MLRSGPKKKCSGCNKNLPASKFHKNRSNTDGYEYICKKCKRVYDRKQYRKPENKERRRNRDLKKRFGIDIKGYNKLLKQQNKCCAICGKPQTKEYRALSIDHNHQTNFIRGLLCSYCNGRLLRYLHDNKKRAIGLIKYLTYALENDKDWV